MRIIYWNIRRAGRKGLRHQINEFYNAKETCHYSFNGNKVNSTRVQRISQSFTISNYIEISHEGLSGSIWLLIVKQPEFY